MFVVWGIITIIGFAIITPHENKIFRVLSALVIIAWPLTFLPMCLYVGLHGLFGIAREAVKDWLK